MFLGGFLGYRPGAWALRMALRSVLTAIVAIGAAYMLETTALPRLQPELKALDVAPTAAMEWVSLAQGRLRYVPVPALALGLAALAFRTFRPVLAVLATLATVIALVVIVGSLVMALAPMYGAARELGI